MAPSREKLLFCEIQPVYRVLPNFTYLVKREREVVCGMKALYANKMILQLREKKGLTGLKHGSFLFLLRKKYHNCW